MSKVIACGVCEFPQDDYVAMYTEGEECPQCNFLYPKVKEWFENITDYDLDLMIKMGAISKQQVIKMYIKENYCAVFEGKNGKRTITINGKDYIIGVDLANA